MNYTKYNYLSTLELVQLIESKNPTSPLIQELLNRIYELDSDCYINSLPHPMYTMLNNSRTTFECPECEVLLDINADFGGDLFYFSLEKA